MTVWMNLEKAAEHVRVSVPTLRREIKAGRLRAFRVGGRKAIRIRQADLDDWLQGDKSLNPDSANAPDALLSNGDRRITGNRY